MRWVNPVLLPGPIEVARAFAKLAMSGELAAHLAASLSRIAIGWALGVAGGVALGVAIGLSTIARSIGIPGVNALFPIPKIAIMPILILWLGIGESSKVATIALGVFFPMAVATFAAIDDVPRNLVRMAQSFGVPFADVVRKVLLPGALPGILSGFRISASIALLARRRGRDDRRRPRHRRLRDAGRQPDADRPAPRRRRRAVDPRARDRRRAVAARARAPVLALRR